MMRHVDLCSGIGGFALGFEWAGLSRPVMFCDIEPWSRKVLAKHWPDVPIEEDVKVLANDPTKIPAGGANTILTAGYPCQPFSQAGKRRGEEDDRHIWPYIREIVAQKRPAWCVFENVYGHVSMGLDTVLSNLEADGYATRAHIVPACGVDAPHRRDRIWIIAHANSQGEPDGAEHVGKGQRMVGNAESIGRHGWAEEAGRAGQTHQPDEPRPEVWGKPSGSGEDVANTYDPRDRTQRHDTDAKWAAAVERRQEQPQPQSSRYSEDVADTSSERLEGHDQSNGQRDWQPGRQQTASKSFSGRTERGVWTAEPPVGRVANGIPRRVDRIKGLGNAIVPQIAMQIGIAIRQCEASATGQ